MPKRAGSELVVVSNRLPVTAQRGREDEWDLSPGGLVSALGPVLRKRSSTWVGWPGRGASAPRRLESQGIQLRPVALSRSQVERYYDGFSNRTLWPLYHDAVRPPQYQRPWWAAYVEVNRIFAAVATEEAASGAIVWVHDYHLQLVPLMIREQRPDLRIGFFLHIPFPPQELFAQLPWRRQILEGLLGADVVGFQTVVGARNFSVLCRRYAGAEGARDELRLHGHASRFGAFPISIDTARFERVAESPEVIRMAAGIRARLGHPRRVLLGVDRLDYTKGIDVRLLAFEELLREKRLDPRQCVLVQVAVPSREEVEDYQALRSEVERLVGSINGEFGEVGRAPVHYLHRSFSLPELVALYRTADVMLVTPVRDGMNLVAKEYVASRVDERGVLMLSEMTGAAHELRGASQVNPYDVEGLKDAMVEAVGMPEAEQERRMVALRRIVARHDVHAWARSFLAGLER
ncbi:MAG: trehalose-6-phosphate synthase [Deltaproteobacteria bacterium]|nr:trehalose-6-phosphate synthase [Deltaproteobacteria bacterium]